MNNYALSDAAGISVAFLLFSLLAFFPGYLLAYLSNLWSFRQRTSAFQIAVSVPLSLGIGPTLTFFLCSLGGWTPVWIFYLAVLLCAAAVLIRARPKPDRLVLQALLAGCAWSVFASLWLMDWQWNNKVYFPAYAFDYATRSAFIHSLAAFGLPARNPLFFPGRAVPLHYHYLWLLQCAFVHHAAPLLITARLALIASAAWCGLGLMCVSALAMRLLFQLRSWTVIALLAVTGLDIVPSLLILWGNQRHLLGTMPPSVEWWNEQVDGWLYTTLWEPHYICALVAVLTGFFVLWQVRRFALVPIAALCFATAVGSGSFVALVFAVFIVVWVALHPRHSGPLLCAGGLACLLLLPYLLQLTGPAQNVKGPRLFAAAIRGFSPVALPPILNLLVLPLNYFLEFGLFGVCVLICYRRKLHFTEAMLLSMAAVSLLLCTFIRSGATPNNDFGWRGMLVAQFALLLLTAACWQRRKVSPVLKILLVLGVAGTTYDLALTRFFPILSDQGKVPKLTWLATDRRLGERTFANREAYAWLARHSPPTAIVAQNANVDSVGLFSGLYGDRNIVAGDRTCTIGFGGAPADCRRVLLLSQNQPCAFADFYLIQDTDPAFRQPRAWLFANQFVRILSCAGSNRPNEHGTF